MANFAFTVGELTSQIKMESKMSLGQLGAAADTYIFYYITEALWELAGEIKKKKTTDPLIVTSNGYVNFKIGGNNIEDLYSPLRILIANEDGTEFVKRTSFVAPNGWIRETQNDPIHIKGTGVYVLQYIAYPNKVTSIDQSVDIPSTSYGLLKDRVIARIKGSLNDLEGITQAVGLANSKIPILTESSKNAPKMTN
jgi:hypothetical protein